MLLIGTSRTTPLLANLAPSGKHLGISHWGSKDSGIQLCGKVSGPAVEAFMKKFPASDAPEPNAQ